METLEIVCSESDLQVTAHSPILLFPPIFVSQLCHCYWVRDRELAKFICCFFHKTSLLKKQRAQWIFSRLTTETSRTPLWPEISLYRQNGKKMENSRHINPVPRWAQTFLIKRKIKKEYLIRWYIEHSPKYEFSMQASHLPHGYREIPPLWLVIWIA